MSHLTKLRSLRDISASVELRIITHTQKDRQTRYTCVCVIALSDGSVRVFKSDDIIVVSPG